MVLYERDGEDISRGLVGHWKLDDLRRTAVDGILAHYKMNDDASDKIVLDSKGGNTGTSINDTDTYSTASGKIGKALSFNGTTDLISLPDDMLAGETSLSIACWVKFETNSGDDATIGMLSYSFAGNKGIIIDRVREDDGSNPQQFRLFLGTTTYIFDKVFENDEWYHIVFTHTGTTSKLYVNGVLEQTRTTKAFTSGGTGDNIGQQNNNGLKGPVDDFRIYDRAINLSEVLQIYGDDGMDAHYKLNDDAADTVVVDIKGDNTGTSTSDTDTLSVAGKINDAFQFARANNDRAAIPNSLIGTSGSMALWVKSADYTLTESPLWFGVALGNLFGPPPEFHINTQNGATGRMQFFFSGDDDNFSVQSNDPMVDGEWVHIVAIWTETTMKMYINGVLQTSQATITEPVDNSKWTSATGFIGGPGSTIRDWNGEIDDVRFYDRAISASEVLEIFGDDGMLAHYKMNDDAADTIVLDSKGGNTGTSANNTDGMSGVGKVNEALTFNGTTDDVKIPKTLIETTGSFSLWVKNADYTNVEIPLWFGDTGGNGLGAHGEFHIHTNTGGSGKMDLFFRSGSSNFGLESNDVFTNTNWYHIAGTWTPTLLLMYVNGVLQTDQEPLTLPIDNSGWAATGDIGNTDGGGVRRWTGEIDDVRFYNKVLTLAEVQTIYNSGTGTEETSVLATGTEETSILATGTETTELFRDTITAIDRKLFNDGTISGCTNIEGVNGQNPDAMFFDGNSDEISTELVSESGIGDLSVSAWVNGVDLLGVPRKDIVTKGKTSDFEWNLSTDNARRPEFSVFSTSGGAFLTATGTALTEDIWYHFVGVIKGEVAYIYVNGELVGSDASTTGTREVDNGAKVFIGSREVLGNDDRWHGRIQNARVYNRALTAGEISKLYRLKR